MFTLSSPSADVTRPLLNYLSEKSVRSTLKRICDSPQLWLLTRRFRNSSCCIHSRQFHKYFITHLYICHIHYFGFYYSNLLYFVFKRFIYILWSLRPFRQVIFAFLLICRHASRTRCSLFDFQSSKQSPSLYRFAFLFSTI